DLDIAFPAVAEDDAAQIRERQPPIGRAIVVEGAGPDRIEDVQRVEDAGAAARPRRDGDEKAISGRADEPVSSRLGIGLVDLLYLLDPVPGDLDRIGITVAVDGGQCVDRDDDWPIVGHDGIAEIAEHFGWDRLA